ncbi:hypothetical protein LGK97_06625 [Clostridium sp. CS001]|nr:hypothetical protein [Clostridium sp. CS001]MCB2289440.1 hypothetical protein [Clostridium sp. CS001]
MNKKYFKNLCITLTVTMFLFILGLATPNNEDPPLLGKTISTEYHI